MSALDPRQPAEHEVIEQLEEEVNGRPLDEIRALLRSLGRDDPMLVLDRMARAGQIALGNADGTRLAEWQQAAVFRGEDPRSDLRVLAIDPGDEPAVG